MNKYERQLRDPTTIVILVEGNPKQPDTAAWHRYNLYKDGMSEAEALAAGITKRDLNWDKAHGFITTLGDISLDEAL
jgi:hypothetical protein